MAKISSMRIGLHSRSSQPAARTSSRPSSKASAVNARTTVLGLEALICRVASYPSITGIRMSIHTRFGRHPSCSATACSPLAATSTANPTPSSSLLLFFTLNREDFSFVIHLDRQPRTSRRREAQTGSRARSGSRSERTLDAVEHSRTLMEWWPFLIFHRGGLRIKVINNTCATNSCCLSCHHRQRYDEAAG